MAKFLVLKQGLDGGDGPRGLVPKLVDAGVDLLQGVHLQGIIVLRQQGQHPLRRVDGGDSLGHWGERRHGSQGAVDSTQLCGDR